MEVYGLLLAGVSLASWNGIANAAPPDFSICDGRAGVALGLCQGGVAAGCAGSDGGTEACVKIEGKYRSLTDGQEAPWISSRYPVNAAQMHHDLGLDLETGALSNAPGAENLSDYPGCLEIGNCASIDLIAHEVKEPYSGVDNAFQFLQATCTDSSEPGYGGAPEFALIRGTAFSEVGQASIDTASFEQAPAYMLNYGLVPPIGSGDSLIVRTCAGNYFKVGNATCNFPEPEWPACNDPTLPEYWVGYDYQMLRPAP
jgi:hypothetical protein